LKLFVQHESVIVPTYYVFLLSALTSIQLSVALVCFFASSDAASKGNSALLSLGTATAIFQAIGFSRWVFTIPMIAHAYFAPNTSESSKQALALMYDTLNRYLGMTCRRTFGILEYGLMDDSAGVAVQQSGRCFGTSFTDIGLDRLRDRRTNDPERRRAFRRWKCTIVCGAEYHCQYSVDFLACGAGDCSLAIS
jgi:hypothetical protein